MRHLGSFRMYEPVIREMARRGHEIHLALGRAEALGWTAALENLLADHPNVTWSRLSPPTTAFWAELAKTIRLWADYLRYLDPEYDRAPKLRARARERVPSRLAALSDWPRFQRAPARRRLAALLRIFERALPPVPEIERELRQRRPDVVLVTPLVYLGSSQFEVLRSALRVGLRTAFCVGSWDHLSSKALVRDVPHRVLVWNATQKDEAVRLHGIPSERVVVTGAQCYDQWFGRRPVRTREEFCRRVALPADRLFIVYVCSALFRGSPVEAVFVQRWIEQLRASERPELRDAAVLVRPHPARMEEWRGVDLARFGHARLYGSNPVDAASKDDYFESLYYSAAVVGLNTSAFLEGAIAGRPVHTILLPEFAENQEGVLHFRYLFTVGGGVLRAGRTFDEHHAQLAVSLSSPAERPGDRFVREFIRPHGLDVPATPVFCDAVDDLVRVEQPAPERSSRALAAVRWAVASAFWALRGIYGSDVFRDDWSRKERAHQQRRELRARDRSERLERERERRRALAQERTLTREAARRAKQEARARGEAEKVRRKRAKVRDRDERRRRRRRAELRAQLKHRAVRLLHAWRPGGESRST
jgi:hypothetical protein